MTPTFIFMLTMDDRTIPDALDRLPAVIGAGIRHIGFKDVGLREPEMQRLAAAIRNSGATLYLETVSLDAESEAASARAAVSLGVDILMGGTRPDIVLPIIAGRGILYYPFAGKVTGHPSILNGPVEAIVASAESLLALDGVDGLDLLAYRFDGDVPDLMRRVCAAAAGRPVIVAGSIDRPQRIVEVLAAGTAGFTIGTAALRGSFCGGDLDAELATIMRAMKAIGS